MKHLVLVVLLATCTSEGDDYPVVPNVSGGPVVTGVHTAPQIDAGSAIDAPKPAVDARLDAPPPADAE